MLLEQLEIVQWHLRPHCITICLVIVGRSGSCFTMVWNKQWEKRKLNRGRRERGKGKRKLHKSSKMIQEWRLEIVLEDNWLHDCSVCYKFLPPSGYHFQNYCFCLQFWVHIHDLDNTLNIVFMFFTFTLSWTWFDTNSSLGKSASSRCQSPEIHYLYLGLVETGSYPRAGSRVHP